MIRITLTAIATGTALLLTAPVHAGGPIIVEDMTESAPIVRDRDNLLPIILLGLAVAIIASGGSSDVCQGPDDQPTPEPGPCR